MVGLNGWNSGLSLITKVWTMNREKMLQSGSGLSLGYHVKL